MMLGTKILTVEEERDFLQKKKKMTCRKAKKNLCNRVGIRNISKIT